MGITRPSRVEHRPSVLLHVDLHGDRRLAGGDHPVGLVVDIHGPGVDGDVGLHVYGGDDAPVVDAHDPGGRGVGTGEDAVGLGLTDRGE